MSVREVTLVYNDSLTRGVCSLRALHDTGLLINSVSHELTQF